MNNISFSSNNVNNRINKVEKSDKNKNYLVSNFKCNKANNRVELTKKAIVLGERVSLWR